MKRAKQILLAGVLGLFTANCGLPGVGPLGVAGEGAAGEGATWCDRWIDTFCQKMIECGYIKDMSSCHGAHGGVCPLTTTCGDGKPVSSAQIDSCIHDFGAQSCADLQQSKKVESCESICK